MNLEFNSTQVFNHSTMQLNSTVQPYVYNQMLSIVEISPSSNQDSASGGLSQDSIPGHPARWSYTVIQLNLDLPATAAVHLHTADTFLAPVRGAQLVWHVSWLRRAQAAGDQPTAPAPTRLSTTHLTQPCSTLPCAHVDGHFLWANLWHQQHPCWVQKRLQEEEQDTDPNLPNEDDEMMDSATGPVRIHNLTSPARWRHFLTSILEVTQGGETDHTAIAATQTVGGPLDLPPSGGLHLILRVEEPWVTSVSSILKIVWRRSFVLSVHYLGWTVERQCIIW